MAAVTPVVLSKDNLKATVDEIIARRGDGKWSERIVSNDHFSMTVIHQPPGTPQKWAFRRPATGDASEALGNQQPH